MFEIHGIIYQDKRPTRPWFGIRTRRGNYNDGSSIRPSWDKIPYKCKLQCLSLTFFVLIISPVADNIKISTCQIIEPSVISSSGNTRNSTRPSDEKDSRMEHETTTRTNESSIASAGDARNDAGTNDEKDNKIKNETLSEMTGHFSLLQNETINNSKIDVSLFTYDFLHPYFDNSNRKRKKNVSWHYFLVSDQ